MPTLIENLYNNNNIDIESFIFTKIKDLSYLDKLILDIENFHGYQENTIIDVIFMNRIPLQMLLYRYKFLMKEKIKK